MEGTMQFVCPDCGAVETVSVLANRKKRCKMCVYLFGKRKQSARFAARWEARKRG